MKKDNNWEIKEYLKSNRKEMLKFLSLAQESGNFKLQEWIKEMLKIEKMDTMTMDTKAFFPEQINNFLNRNQDFEYLKGNKILFYGPPGTGKTFAAVQISDSLKIKMTVIKYSDVISKRMGDTMKNLELLFINDEKEILFLDEVDVILTNRLGSDIDEMKRVTGNFLWLLDNLPKNKLLILATNIVDTIDEAIMRRIDYKFNFDQYESEKLVQIYKHELRNKKFYAKSKDDTYLSDSFFSKKILNLIKESEGITPFKIKKSLDQTEDFYIKHGENNYFYMVEPFIQNDYKKNIKENIVIQLRDMGFSINEIFTILKSEFSISNEKIRKIVREIKNGC